MFEAFHIIASSVIDSQDLIPERIPTPIGTITDLNTVSPEQNIPLPPGADYVLAALQLDAEKLPTVLEDFNRVVRGDEEKVTSLKQEYGNELVSNYDELVNRVHGSYAELLDKNEDFTNTLKNAPPGDEARVVSAQKEDYLTARDNFNQAIREFLEIRKTLFAGKDA